jgi:carbonic anhydrase
MNTLELLSHRNREFASNRFAHNPTLMPKLRTLILGCSDPRVDPAHVLGLEPGETAVIRNVGGRVTASVLREIAMLQAVGRAEGGGPGGRFDIIVLHHTDCGITRLEARREMLSAFFELPQDALGVKAVGDPRASVAVDVAVLRALPLPPGWFVSGLVYEVRTGLIETVVPPESVAPSSDQ